MSNSNSQLSLDFNDKKVELIKKDIYKDSYPFLRWWWFSGKIKIEDIKYQLDWIKNNNFGGVEIAWVYPVDNTEEGIKFLSDEWSETVKYAKEYATEIGLGCDFTFGTLWPFGGSFVEKKDASRNFNGISKQRLKRSWESAYCEPGYILNHLNRESLKRYSETVGRALKDALSISDAALFCDSWEVRTEKLWTEGFGKTFREKFGYEIEQWMNDLHSNPQKRYDYRKLISGYVIREFYNPFTEICHKLGAISRVQCHGSPTDLLKAYCSVDVPESESILFDPPFSRFAASAAAITGVKTVSAESFTCLYGWSPYPGPGPYQGHEQIADIKLLADSLFSNGVNFIIWHGMPYNPAGKNNRFYASVHVSPDSSFAKNLPDFNHYLKNLSCHLKKGKTFSELAFYLPIEDNWMKNELPEEMKTPGAKYRWELRHCRIPENIRGYNPLWISFNLLRESTVRDNVLNCRNASFKILYIDVEWLDVEGLREIHRVAEKGLPVYISRKPRQPGYKKDSQYDKLLDKLMSLENVSTEFSIFKNIFPVVEGSDMPEFWCREDKNGLIIFFAHPLTKTVKYPMKYGQSKTSKIIEKKVTINYNRNKIPLKLKFEPYQSLLLRIDREGNFKFLDISFHPPEPVRI